MSDMLTPPPGSDQPGPRHGLHPQQADHSEPLYAALPAPNLSNGQATAGLVVGVASLFLNTFFIVSALGLVFSALGLRNADRFRSVGYAPRGRGPAIVGLVCAIVGVVLSVVFKGTFGFLI